MPDGWPEAVLSLADHCADVAAIVAALLDSPLIRARLHHLTDGTLTDDQCSAMVGAAFLHDIGKANRGFWRKQLPPGERGPVAGHLREVAPLLFGFPPIRLAEAGEFLDPDTPAGTFLLAALGHHGAPIPRDMLQGEAHKYRHVWQAGEGYDPVSEAGCLANAMARVLPDSMAAAARLTPPPASLLHAFLGLLSLADWIGSNAAEGFFPFDGHGAGERWPFATDRAAAVLRAMRLDAGPARAALVAAAPGFGDVFRDRDRPLSPTGLQAAMARTDLGPIVVVEAPTGSGKTEAALWRFRTLLAEGLVDSLAFLLPTRTAAVQIEARVQTATQRLWPNPDSRPNVVLAVPGYLHADGEEGLREHRYEVQWPDSADEWAAHRRWAAESPKRSLAGAIVVGTIDQALLAALCTRHAHLRGACLLRALLVVDEVHASDIYMTGLLRTLLARHQAAGGHALLLSATLGAAARVRLQNPSPMARPKIPPLENATALPYPLISDRTQSIDPGGASPCRCVRRVLDPWLDEPEAIAARALSAAQDGARVLVVRNTVAGAIAVQRALEAEAPDDAVLFRAGGVVAPHHGRFAAPDRRLLDSGVEQAFGKHAARQGGCVLVGTQTLEQSLDIDADLLLTDLCPMDVLLQRLGRLHRHQRPRPAGFEEPTAHILVPAQRDLSPFLPKRARGLPRHGLGELIYSDLFCIEATWRLLELRPVLTLPRDNRVLVEHATHPEALDLIARELGATWDALRTDLKGRQAAHQTQAAYAALRWEEDLLEMRFAKEPGEEAATRLGLRDRRFQIDPPIAGPFGLMLRELVVPGWMVRDIAESIEVATAVQEGEALRLNVGDVRFRYGRLGLEWLIDQRA